MKTLKIAEPIHQELTEIQANFYKDTGIKLTFNEIIANLIIAYNRKQKKEYQFDDK